MKEVEVNIEITTTPEMVISSFTEARMLTEWWKVERSLVEKKNGGIYSLAWGISEAGFGYITTGTIKNYVPDRLLKIQNLVYFNPEKSILGPMTLTVEATPLKKGCSLYLCQSGYQSGSDWDWYYEAVKNAWPQVVLMLKAYLEANFAIS